MEILMNDKLANAIGVKAELPCETINPLFTWTAEWVNTFEDQQEDMIVLVNQANHFTVVIFGVNKDQFNDIEYKIKNAIRNTLLVMQVNPDVIEDYLNLAGEIVYASKDDSNLTELISSRVKIAKIIIGNMYKKSRGKTKYHDSFGHTITMFPKIHNTFDEVFVPDEEIINNLAKLTGKPVYNYTAFELLVTLDLEIYKATRRVIVDANIKFSELHKLLQEMYDWGNYHLYDFVVLNKKKQVVRIVPFEDDLPYDQNSILMGELKLLNYFPKYSKILYTYDYGDCWEHEIELVRVIKNHNEKSPFLIEAIGQSPPEDVGGVPGYIDFREIMLNPNHPEYDEMSDWACSWTLELSEKNAKPRALQQFHGNF